MKEAQELIIGSWKLVSVTFEKRNGNIRHLFGENPPPCGMLMYDAEGNFSSQVEDARRRKIPAVLRWIFAGYRGYKAYFGKYTIDPRTASLTHNTLSSLMISSIGKDQIRQYAFPDPDTLILKASTHPAGRKERIIEVRWKRIQKDPIS